jgi:hypothetical protein
MKAKLLKILPHNRTLFMKVEGGTTYYGWDEAIDWQIDGVEENDIVDITVEGEFITQIKMLRKPLSPEQSRQRSIIYQSCMNRAVEITAFKTGELQDRFVEDVKETTRDLAEFIFHECDI